MSSDTRRHSGDARRRAVLLAALACLFVPVRLPLARTPEPIIYTVRLLPETQAADVQAIVPTDGRAAIEVMMAVWSPGFYRVENYARYVEGLTARTPDGTVLEVSQPRANRWRIQTSGGRAVVVSYRVRCAQRSVTADWVSSDLAVLNGAPTFVTLADERRRPNDVRLQLPASLKQAMTALNRAPDGRPNHYRADDFDTLVDSPIVAGTLEANESDVAGSRHFLVNAGEVGQFEGKRAAADLQKIVEQARTLWGFLPYKKYVFLNVFRQGGGGLEHKDSTLLTANAARAATGAGYRSWLSFAAHEYFHAFNVKRLRPVELGPFDYETEPHTKSLWIAEGFTSYYAEVLLARAGIDSLPEALSALSSPIRPGRLLLQGLHLADDGIPGLRRVVTPSAVRDQYLARFNQFMAAHSLLFRSLEIPHCVVRTDQDPWRALAMFLAERKRLK